MFIKKITPAEKNELKLRPVGKTHPVRAALMLMEVGEILRISRAAFRWKKLTPKRLTNEISKASEKEFEVSQLLDNTGWVVERLS